jgi:beta-glucosidase
VVSDAFAVRNLLAQGFARDRKDAAARALAAGLDMDMASGTFAQQLVALVKQGTLEEAQIDAAVRRILSAKLRLGLFEAPYADEARAASVFADPQHRAEARRAAQRSMVLLRNEKKLLPLPQSLTNVAVIGPLADSKPTPRALDVFGHVPAAVTVLEGSGPAQRAGHHAPGRDPARGAVLLRDFFPAEEAGTAEGAGRGRSSRRWALAAPTS